MGLLQKGLKVWVQSRLDPCPKDTYMVEVMSEPPHKGYINTYMKKIKCEQPDWQRTPSACYKSLNWFSHQQPMNPELYKQPAFHGTESTDKLSTLSKNNKISSSKFHNTIYCNSERTARNLTHTVINNNFILQHLSSTTGWHKYKILWESHVKFYGKWLC